MSLSFYSTELRFFKLAKDILGGENPPIPLRRVFSLLRIIEPKCETIVHKINSFTDKCLEENCGERKDSCQYYIKHLSKYGYSLSEKQCHKLLFFSTKFGDVESFEKEEANNLIGFCIIHKDIVSKEESADGAVTVGCSTGPVKIKKHCRIYLPECVFKSPSRLIKGFSYGNYSSKIGAGSKVFKIKGNYFSQQNAITDCCAQAAIKMAVRAYYPEITSEKINGFIGVDHKKKMGNKRAVAQIIFQLEA